MKLKSVFPYLSLAQTRPALVPLSTFNSQLPLLALALAGFAFASATAAEVEKPIVFLDKSPVIVKYQLGRLSNEQLLLVDRETTHPKFIPLWETLLARPGMPAKFRSEAAEALATLNKSDVPTELLAGIKRATASPPVIAELSKLLVTQKPEDLKQSQPAIEALAGESGPAAARQAAFAALVGILPAEALWTFAQSKPDALAHLVAGLPLAPDGANRAAFAGKILPLLAPGADAAALCGWRRKPWPPQPVYPWPTRHYPKEEPHPDAWPISGIFRETQSARRERDPLGRFAAEPPRARTKDLRAVPRSFLAA